MTTLFRPLDTLMENFDDARRQKIALGARVSLLEYALVSSFVAQCRPVSEEEFAAIADKQEEAVAALEQAPQAHTEILLQSLRDYVAILGGELELNARFGDEVISLKPELLVLDEATTAPCVPPKLEENPVKTLAQAL